MLGGYPKIWHCWGIEKNSVDCARSSHSVTPTPRISISRYMALGDRCPRFMCLSQASVAACGYGCVCVWRVCLIQAWSQVYLQDVASQLGQLIFELTLNSASANSLLEHAGSIQGLNLRQQSSTQWVAAFFAHTGSSPIAL